MNILALRPIPFQIVIYILLHVSISIFVVCIIKSKFALATAYTRKLFHFLIFVPAAIFQFLYGIEAVLLLGSFVFLVVVYAVCRGSNNAFFNALARESDLPHQGFFIIIPLLTTAVGGLLSNLFFPAFAFIGYLVGGIGDAIAEPIGKKWGKHQYKVHSLFGMKATRSLEGSTSVFLSSLLILYPLYRFLSYSQFISIQDAFIVAFAVTLVEAYSTHGFDNLSIQLTAAGLSYYLLT